MLGQAEKGLRDAGAETELINLYDVSFKGCISCFACKRKGSKTYGHCAFHDPLTPILEKAMAADILVIGSPIYFSYPTGETRSFMERLMFPILTYNPKNDEGTGETRMTLLDRVIPAAMIYTMGCPPEIMKEENYQKILGQNERFLKMLFGYAETLCSNNTYQFDDYSKYDVADFVEPMRREWRERHWPEDLRKAYELGERLVAQAKMTA